MQPVLSTLFINALTISKAMQWLGLGKLNKEEEVTLMRTLKDVKNEVYQPLYSSANHGSLSSSLLKESEGVSAYKGSE